MKNTNTPLIVTILFTALLISGSMVFLGVRQKGQSPADGDLQAEIQKGIETYIQDRQAEAVKPPAVQGDYSDDDAFMGKKNAPVTIVEWSDYQCPFCRRFYNDTLPELKTKYINTGKVKFVYRDFPLSFHQGAAPAATAAECARKQEGDEMYFAYHDKIFEGQNALGQGTVNIPEEALRQYAVELGLDTDEFNECLAGNTYAEEIRKDFEDGQQVGVTGTPGFLINGQLIPGAQPFSVFEPIIERELSQ